MHQTYPDRAMRIRHKKDHGNTTQRQLRAITAVLAIITALWILSTVQPMPKQTCNVSTFDGQSGTYSQCK